MRIADIAGHVRTVGVVRPVRSRHPDLTKPTCTHAWIQVDCTIDGLAADLVVAVPIQAVRNGLLGRNVRVTVEVLPEPVQAEGDQLAMPGGKP